MTELLTQLHGLPPIEINQLALGKLNELLERCSVNLVSSMTGITRPTLYRWLDTDISYEEMDHRIAAWFILYCETSPKAKLLLDRPPLSHKRMAKRVIEDGENNANA